MKILSYFNSGNSFPVILEKEGAQYFVKLHAGMSGQHALVNEWVGNELGRQLQIKTQVPSWIELNTEVEVEAIHIEVKELIGKSLGINIGFPFQEKATEITKSDIGKIDPQTALEVYLLDLMMINIDRTPSNLNLMRVETEIISVDYESSLLCQEILGHKNLLAEERILQCLKQNPLYREISEKKIQEFLFRTANISIGVILAGIPTTLLSDADRTLLANGIEKKQKNKWFLMETMDKLKGIKTETRAEQKSRRNKNQAIFRKRFNTG
ncbi:MAG: HipA family kinase [Saprospiraceae bacterium]